MAEVGLSQPEVWMTGGTAATCGPKEVSPAGQADITEQFLEYTFEDTLVPNRFIQDIQDNPRTSQEDPDNCDGIVDINGHPKSPELEEDLVALAAS